MNPKYVRSFLVLVVLAILFATVWEGPLQAVSAQDAGPAFAGLLPRSLLATQLNPPAELWGRAQEGLGVQDAELRMPSFLPQWLLSTAEARSQKPEVRSKSAIGNHDGGSRTTQPEPEGIGNWQSRVGDRYAPAASAIGVGLRDPFKLPAPPRLAVGENDPVVPGNRPPGSRGLLIAQLRLKGVVRDSGTQKMIAVVINSSNHAYFLREGEAVYDGMVSKITPDAVYFKENVLDAKHEVHSREVVKTLNSAAGEVR